MATTKNAVKKMRIDNAGTYRDRESGAVATFPIVFGDERKGTATVEYRISTSTGRCVCTPAEFRARFERVNLNGNREAVKA